MVRWKELMRILFLNGILCLLLGILVGCDGDKSEESTADSKESHLVLESKEEGEIKRDDAEDIDPEGSMDPNVDAKQDVETLAEFSSEQVEYARIWLQLGANQDLDELNVRHITAGTPLNPYDETSENYPEDVTQLAGSRLVDGSVTYSSNRNGSINVYNVPLLLDVSHPDNFYTEIIKNKKLVYVNPGDDEKVIELINLLHVHN
ncbi:hypothetical protein [Peribacillus sp. NPDC097295]|uniref:hypothetical protein n=1 Tax=Peribacillus sp. NPDC097295 TaxID=3364402 RepID=UPI0037FD3CEF